MYYNHDNPSDKSESPLYIYKFYNIWLLWPTFTINTHNQQCKANLQLQTSQKERRLLLSFIGLEQFRAAIGLFNSSIGRHDFKSSLFFWTFILPNFFFYNWVLQNLIIQCGDVQQNPGPNNTPPYVVIIWRANNN